MEGDLLGLDFGTPTSTNQTQQYTQSNFSDDFQLQFLSAQSVSSPWQPLPTEPQITPPAGILQPPPANNQPEPTVALLTPPVGVTQPPLAYNQPQPAVAQPPPSAGSIQSLPANYQAPAPQQETPTVQHPWPADQSVHGPNSITSLPAQNTFRSVAESVWKPAASVDEPKDPVLKEINEKFAGRWKLARSDPYDDYLKAAGVGIFVRKLAIAGPVEQHIEIKGNSIHIDFHATFHNQINVFKLEESVENLVEKSRQSVFCSYKDGKLTLLMTPLELGMNRTQEIQRYINEHGELVTIYTCGTATCRRYFAKMPDLVSPLNIVG